MILDLETVVLVKPKAYEKLDLSAAKGYFKAEQRQLSAIKNALIDIGEKQIKSRTGYNEKNIPDKSPKATPEFSLDKIKFNLSTYVRATNPPYQKVLDKIMGFLEVSVNDKKQGIRKDNIKTDKDGTIFIDLDYLMKNALWYTSNETDFKVENQFNSISAPKEYDEMGLERLVLPVSLMKNFDMENLGYIERPGTAKIWYLARRFHDEVTSEVIVPVKKEVNKRSGISKSNIPYKTQKYWDQVENVLFVVQNIPSPRRQAGQLIKRIFKVPQKAKKKGSTALPMIPNPENYQKLIHEYEPIIPASLKKWKKLDGNIGELVIFYYNGLVNDPKVQEQFPFLPEYQFKVEDGRKFVSLQALYDRMNALEADYTKNRLLRKHDVVQII